MLGSTTLNILNKSIKVIQTPLFSFFFHHPRNFGIEVIQSYPISVFYDQPPWSYKSKSPAKKHSSVGQALTSALLKATAQTENAK